MLKNLFRQVNFAKISLWMLGLMFVLPLFAYHHVLPIPSFYNEWIAAALGLAALTLFLCSRYWQDMELPVVALVPFGLVLAMLIQIPSGRILFPEHNVLGASYLLWALMLMMLARVLVRGLGVGLVAETLAWFLVCGGVLNAGIAMFQQFGVHSFLDPVIILKVRIPFANIAQPNHFSDYIALALGSLLLLVAKRRIHVIVALLCAALLLYVLSFSGSRSSWLYVVAMAVSSLWFFAVNRELEARRLVIAGFLLIPGFAMAQYLVPLSVATPTDNLFTLAGSKSDRLAIWNEAWQMFLNAPLMGIGFGEFAWQHFSFSDQAPEVIRGRLYNHSHNIVLQVLAELGLPAALLLVGGVLLWLRQLLRSGFVSLEAWWAFALLAVLGIHSMLEFPLWYTYFLGIAAVLLGVGETRFYLLYMQRVGQKIFVAVMLLGILSLGNLIQNYSAFEGAFVGVGKALSKTSDLEMVERTVRGFVSQIMDVHRESLLSSYAEIAFSRGIVIDRENLSGKLEVNGRAMHAAPINEIVYRQAILLALNGEQLEAARQFSLAAAAYPSDVAPVIMLLKRKASQWDGAGVEKLLDHALSVQQAQSVVESAVK